MQNWHSANGITACGDCHRHFDSLYVGVNPDNMLVEVSKALLYSEDSKVKDKWSKIVGKRIEAKSTMGHWPSVEAFREKYSVFCTGRDKRQANQSELRFRCDECQKGFRTAKGVQSHKFKNGCVSYKAENKPVSPPKESVAALEEEQHKGKIQKISHKKYKKSNLTFP